MREVKYCAYWIYQYIQAENSTRARIVYFAHLLLSAFNEYNIQYSGEKENIARKSSSRFLLTIDTRTSTHKFTQIQLEHTEIERRKNWSAYTVSRNFSDNPRVYKLLTQRAKRHSFCSFSSSRIMLLAHFCIEATFPLANSSFRSIYSYIICVFPSVH